VNAPTSLTPGADGYPDNPVLVRVRRGGPVESVHRGAWCLTDTAGTVLEGAGSFDEPVYARSSIKSLQALPLLESGAAERFGFSDEELALAMASHSGEPCHTRTVAAALERLGLGEGDLRCGVHPPNDPDMRFELRTEGKKPSQLHNNCSGKHTGFLALARHLSVPPERYLDPAGAGQVLVREALHELTETPLADLVPAIDGCSAPTYRISLRRLAMAFARITNPTGLSASRAAALQRITRAASRNPILVAGSRKRIDTALIQGTSGRLFPKIGAEGVYAVGVNGGDRALAVKVDDGGLRGLHAVVLELLRRLGLAESAELAALDAWNASVLTNHSGLEVGHIEVPLA